ncbi:hypothetical protein ACN27B_13230 [Micromonospora sp. WMMD754]|uniref:hypothetical protein n=1 Tax=unclassified Micromonospora TaxID=2617518 RepID=UPI0012FE101B|nr:hypothetical protein [Micromonospora sp. WMMA2032]
MSLSQPATGPATAGRDGLWTRRLLALLAGTAVAAAATRGLLALGPAGLDRIRDVAWVAGGVHLAQRHWRPRRTGRLVWRTRVVGRRATEAGLVARRSVAGLLGLAAGLVFWTLFGVGTVSLLPDRWYRFGVAAVALGLGLAVHREARFTGPLALTASGIRDGGAWYPWVTVRAAELAGDEPDGGVALHLLPERLPRPVVGGREVTVSDERLLTAIEQFRAAPGTLSVGLPVIPPEPAARPGVG